jgi:hypothetical protein
MLADGTRALTSAGRWQEVRIHLKKHKGIDEPVLVRRRRMRLGIG